MNNCVAVAGTTREEIGKLLPIARILADTRNAPLLILGLVAVPEGESLSTGARLAQSLRQEIEKQSRKVGRQAHTVVRVAHHVWQEAAAVAQAEECDLMLINWSSVLPSDVLALLPCDVVILNHDLPARIKRILLPIRGGPYAALSLQVALAFATAYDAEITLLHTRPTYPLRGTTYREFLLHLRALAQITQRVTTRGDAARAIIRHARTHQLLVMGAIARPQPGDPPIGPTVQRVLHRTLTPALVVKSRYETSPTALKVDYTISVVVDKWFAENTFHAHEFHNIRRLVELKEQQGLTISLGLPALNEAETIGHIVKMLKTALMWRYPLLDEIVLIDSDSTDETVKIARNLDVPVYRHREILPQYGSLVGKGEALWKSLYALKGDLIAWIDTDIRNIDPRFVYGLVGPLIMNSHLMYVKGFYQRPLRFGKKLESRGGGRVTELMARPLFNLFYPELSGMVQPLAGEYGGRREALEQMPFFSGYGVETGLLIDILNRFGLNALGQVDLEERIHRNQSLFDLSKMAYAILQVVMQRVGGAREIELLNELNASMKLVRYEPDQFRLDVQEIRDHERPPIISLPEYRRARRRRRREAGMTPVS